MYAIAKFGEETKFKKLNILYFFLSIMCLLNSKYKTFLIQNSNFIH